MQVTFSLAFFRGPLGNWPSDCYYTSIGLPSSAFWCCLGSSFLVFTNSFTDSRVTLGAKLVTPISPFQNPSQLWSLKMSLLGTPATMLWKVCFPLWVYLYFRYSEQRKVKMGFGRICYIIILIIRAFVYGSSNSNVCWALIKVDALIWCVIESWCLTLKTKTLHCLINEYKYYKKSSTLGGGGTQL